MKKILILILLLLPYFTYADDNIEKIFKITSYKYDDLTKSYSPFQFGSSIYVGDNLIYTNAHVILDENKKPIGNYEVCKTINFKEKPECFSDGELLYYDEKKDLAILKISSPGVSKVNLSNKKLNIGDVIKVYGYPRSGGNTISYTEGKISGYEKGLYKIDANIDAGNSGGGVFDKNGKLIGIAVSVVVGYSTMGYIIPIEDIENFKNKKNKSDIKEYNKSLDKNFNSYLKTSQISKKMDNFNNNYINIASLKKYGFKIDYYFIDNNKDYFSIKLLNNNTYIVISNSNFLGNDLSINTLLNNDKKNLIEYKEAKAINNFKINKIKFKGKDSIITYSEGLEGNISISLNIEINKNQSLDIFISSDSIKNKELLNGLNLIFKGLNLNNFSKPDLLNYSNFNNLKVKDYGDFYNIKDVDGDNLFSINEDIKVLKSVVTNFEKALFENDTLSSILKDNYDYNESYLYFNETSIKKNSLENYYLYSFYLNNKIKKSQQELKYAKKYAIDVYFYDKKDDENIYENHFSFSFDKIESKKIIEDFLNNLSINSNESIFELGDLKINENIVKESEFDFINDSTNKDEQGAGVVNNIKSEETQNKKTENNNNYCSVELSGVTYKLDPCNINYSMDDGKGDEKFTFKLIPSNSNESYSFEIYGQGEGFPPYGIVGGDSSGGANGTQFFTKIFNDVYLNKGKYNGYLKIFVYDKDGLKRELRLNINLDVK